MQPSSRGNTVDPEDEAARQQAAVLIERLSFLGSRELAPGRPSDSPETGFVPPPFFRGLPKPAGAGGLLLMVDLADTLVTADAVTLTRLADSLRKPLSTVSRLVDTLEDQGVVVRQAHPTDGRAVLVSLTPLGRRRFEDARWTVLGPLRRRLGRLTRDELEQLTVLLARLTG